MPLLPPTLQLRAYQAISALALCSILADIAYVLYWGLMPIDVSGTLMGGGYGQLMYMMRWCVTLAGLGVCSLVGLPGHRLAWGAAGMLQVGIGLWWRVGYPTDENLIYLPEAGDITSAIVIGLGTTALAVWRSRAARVRVGTAAMAPRSVMALALILGYLGVPLHEWLSEPLPYCSFDKAGNQLTICLGDEPRVYR